MITQVAPFPALGVDCITVLNATSAAALKAAGMRFAIRYLGSITPIELAEILGAGLVFMPVTFSRAPGWVPTAAMGTSDGQTDVQHIKALGLPSGCTVWIDLEGAIGSASTVSAWVNARAQVIRLSGYDVGLYVGYGSVLDSAQLYALAEVDRYWKSLSDVPTPTCGFSMMQLWKTTVVAGVSVDVDCIQYDYNDRLPNVVAL